MNGELDIYVILVVLGVAVFLGLTLGVVGLFYRPAWGLFDKILKKLGGDK